MIKCTKSASGKSTFVAERAVLDDKTCFFSEGLARVVHCPRCFFLFYLDYNLHDINFSIILYFYTHFDFAHCNDFQKMCVT